MPWGVHRIGDIYGCGVQSGLPDGRYVAAIAEPHYSNLFERVRAAWWVLTGRAVAFRWSANGDLEKAFQPPRPRLPEIVAAEKEGDHV